MDNPVNSIDAESGGGMRHDASCETIFFPGTVLAVEDSRRRGSFMTVAMETIRLTRRRVEKLPTAKFDAGSSIVITKHSLNFVVR